MENTEYVSTLALELSAVLCTTKKPVLLKLGVPVALFREGRYHFVLLTKNTKEDPARVTRHWVVVLFVRHRADDLRVAEVEGQHLNPNIQDVELRETACKEIGKALVWHYLQKMNFRLDMFPRTVNMCVGEGVAQVARQINARINRCPDDRRVHLSRRVPTRAANVVAAGAPAA